jgi:Fur family ferric uptake transcriptional regulator
MARHQVADAVRARGGRMTVQRRLILEALARAKHDTTADELAREVRARHPQVDPSTVYRNLASLEELGYVAHTHFDDGVTRWHRTGAQRHGHLVCRECGAEEQIELAALEPLARRLRARHGFRADLGHSAIVGICRQCASVSSD